MSKNTALQIGFYHLKGTKPGDTETVLPALLKKATQTGQPIVLVTPTKAQAQRLDERLWTLEKTSFSPHSTLPKTPKKHSLTATQMWITSLDDFITYMAEKTITTESVIVFSFFGALTPQNTQELTKNTLKITRILDLFTSAEKEITQARIRWKDWKTQASLQKNQKPILTYTLQTPQGWQKKA